MFATAHMYNKPPNNERGNATYSMPKSIAPKLAYQESVSMPPKMTS
jgi:hypothetical protein